MSTVVLNEDEARSLLSIIEYQIHEEIMNYSHDTNHGEEGLDCLGDLFSIRKKCMEAVSDG